MKSIDLLAAHLVGDYILQTNDEAMNKINDKRKLFKHVTKYTLAFAPATLLSKGSIRQKTLFLLATFIIHAAIDHRRWASGEE